MEITIDWPRIHAAAAAVDSARRSGPGRWFGTGACSDAWGGTYFPAWYEGRGLAGLVCLAGGADLIRRAVWDEIHTARPCSVAAATLQDADRHLMWHSDQPSPRYHATRRGARWRATHYGGHVTRVVETPWSVQQQLAAAAARVGIIVERARAAVRTALALHDLFTALADTGVVEYRPESVICGVTDTLQVTGLRWLAGEPDEGQPIRTEVARAFAMGAPVAVLIRP